MAWPKTSPEVGDVVKRTPGMSRECPAPGIVVVVIRRRLLSWVREIDAVAPPGIGRLDVAVGARRDPEVALVRRERTEVPEVPAGCRSRRTSECPTPASRVRDRGEEGVHEIRDRHGGVVTAPAVRDDVRPLGSWAGKAGSGCPDRCRRSMSMSSEFRSRCGDWVLNGENAAVGAARSAFDLAGDDGESCRHTRRRRRRRRYRGNRQRRWPSDRYNSPPCCQSRKR